MSEKELYETPRFSEIGDMTGLTRQCGWGLDELFASIIGSGSINTERGCRESGTCTPSFS